MPYKEVIVHAETLLQHKGIKVYHTYKNNCIHEPAWDYNYTLDPLGTDNEEGSFDVRDLSSWVEPKSPEQRERHIKCAIKTAIASGELFAVAGVEKPFATKLFIES